MRHLRVGGYASELNWALDTGQWTVFKHFSDQNSSQIVEKTAEKNGFKIMRFREYNLIYLKEIILNKNPYICTVINFQIYNDIKLYGHGNQNTVLFI